MPNPREDLLDFIMKKRIPIRLAIDILEQAEQDIQAKKAGKEKQVSKKYETR
jgi:hypothetical protein